MRDTRDARTVKSGHYRGEYREKKVACLYKRLQNRGNALILAAEAVSLLGEERREGMDSISTGP
jgi:hypothetical protein